MYNLIITKENGWFKYRARLFKEETLLKDIQTNKKEDIFEEINDYLKHKNYIIEDQTLE